jgi:hypothetical protein
MTDELPPIPALLQAARSAYGVAIHREVASRQLRPLPPQGAFVLGALHRGASLDDILHERGRAMEKAMTLSHLTQSGYVVHDDEGLRLTERGHECAHAVYDATSDLTTHVATILGETGFESFVTGLLALIDIKEAGEEH